MDKELERLELLKEEAIKNPGKPKKGCKSCKKPKEIIIQNAPLPNELEEFIPFPEQITQAYVMMANPKEEEKWFISHIYRSIFNEEYDFTCRTCVHTQIRKMGIYIKDVLKLKI